MVSLKGHRHLYQARRAVFILAGVFGACSGLRLQQPFIIDSSDWTMFGRHESRTSATAETITPPLSLLWDCDITGGIGNASPLVIDSVVIVGNLRGELYGINAYTGKRIGWVDLGDAIQGAPVIEGNIAFVAISNSDLSLIAFDLFEGKPKWRKEYGDIETSPLLHHQRIYVGNTEGVLYCADSETGEQVWKFELPGNTKHKGIRSSAACLDNRILFGADDGFVYALDAENGSLKWTYDTGSPVVSTPCVGDSAMIVGNLDGIISSIDVRSGTVRWHFDAGTSIYASPSFADNVVFIGTTGGVMFGLDAVSGRMIWKSNLGGVINSAALVAGNTLYVGTLKKSLYALSAANGDIILKQDVPGRVKTSPVIAGQKLFVATDDKLILAFRSAVP